MVGSDPKRFKALADETRMPQDRQDTCLGDYNTAEWGWNKALEPHRRAPDGPRTEIKVTYGPADSKDGLDIYANVLRSVGVLDTIASRMSEDFAWSAPLTFSAQACGDSGAYWNHPTRTLILCYELAADFSRIYRSYAPERKPQPPRRTHSR
jgi:hypothetical protein